MFWIILTAVIVFLFAFVLGFVCQKMFDLALVRGKKLVGDDGFKEQLDGLKGEWDAGKALYDTVEKEDLWIDSFDGLRLHGTLLRNGDSKKLVIQAHGFRSSPVHDFVAIFPYFWNKGFSVLMVDHRAHCESEGTYITYGVHERCDMRDWVYKAMEVLGEDAEIILHGISMGASTVLMTSALDLPENVKGIIADSGFTSPYDIFVEVLDHSFHAPPFPILPITSLMAEFKANFGFKDASTISAMEENRIPVILFHGEDDDFVPIEMSEANFEACKGKKEFVRIKGAKHACGYVIDKATCTAAMDKFISEIMQ